MWIQQTAVCWQVFALRDLKRFLSLLGTDHRVPPSPLFPSFLQTDKALVVGWGVDENHISSFLWLGQAVRMSAGQNFYQD